VVAAAETIIFSAALILVASSNVHATEALLFDGGGYTIEVLIGYLDDPVIAQAIGTFNATQKCAPRP